MYCRSKTRELGESLFKRQTKQKIKLFSEPPQGEHSPEKNTRDCRIWIWQAHQNFTVLWARNGCGTDLYMSLEDPQAWAITRWDNVTTLGSTPPASISLYTRFAFDSDRACAYLYVRSGQKIRWPCRRLLVYIEVVLILTLWLRKKAAGLVGPPYVSFLLLTRTTRRCRCRCWAPARPPWDWPRGPLPSPSSACLPTAPCRSSAERRVGVGDRMVGGVAP